MLAITHEVPSPSPGAGRTGPPPQAAQQWLSGGLISRAPAREAAKQRPRFPGTNSDIYKGLSVVTRSKPQHSFKSHNNSQTPSAQGLGKKPKKQQRPTSENDKALMR